MPLATQVDDGTPILFANDLDIHSNGSIFFTDTSKKYNRVPGNISSSCWKGKQVGDFSDMTLQQKQHMCWKVSIC